jgi:DNA-binding CsgD family transcriptional regulator
VYDDFLKRLGEEFPNLSLSDKRMCAYLRMGLNTKDISPLLGMTVRSVEMTRYRLRRKLGLSREHNLTDFLQRY